MEAALLAAFGQPQGAVIVKDAKTELLYGKSQHFIFRKGELKELVVSDHRYVFDGERSSTTLRFASWRGRSGPESCRLHGFSIVHCGA